MVHGSSPLYEDPKRYVEGKLYETPSGETVAFTGFTQTANLEDQIKGKKWNERVIDVLDWMPKKLIKAQTTLGKWEVDLEGAMPSHRLQRGLDNFGNKIHELSKAHELNKWIDSNGMGAWYKQLCLYLMKLPLRAVRNILRPIFAILKGTVYMFVHPLKGSLRLAKFLIGYIYALSRPETYTKIGSATIGFSLAHAAMSGGFGLHAYIGLGVGGALLLGGITVGAIEAGLRAKDHRLQAVGQTLWNHVKMVPEAMLTGFIMGVIMGAIQLILFPDSFAYADHGHVQHDIPPVTDQQTAYHYVDTQFLPQHHLPDPTSITVDPNGDIHMIYTGEQLQQFNASPDAVALLPAKPFTFGHPPLHGPPDTVTITLQHQISPGLDLPPDLPNTSIYVTSNAEHWGYGSNPGVSIPGYNYPGYVPAHAAATSPNIASIDLITFSEPEMNAWKRV